MLLLFIDIAGESRPLEVDDDLEPEGCTVAGLKAHIEDAFDLLRSKQLLSYHGTPLLDPTVPLRHLEISDLSTVSVSAAAAVDSTLALSRAGIAEGVDVLCRACWSGELHTVRLQLLAGVDANAVSHAVDMTPLQCAAATDRADVAELLLSLGAADPNLPAERPPLWVAADAGACRAAAVLLRSGATANAPDRSGRPPVFAAAGAGRVEAVRMLLGSGRGCGGGVGVDGSSVGVVDVDARDSLGASLLMRCAESGDAGLQSVGLLLLEVGCDAHAVDLRGRNAVSYAVAAEGGGDGAVLSRLLAAGVDAQAIDCATGRPPLYDAVRHGRPAVAEALLAAGAAVEPHRGFAWPGEEDDDEDGEPCQGRYTPLAYAAVLGRVEVARVLLVRGACVGGAGVNRACLDSPAVAGLIVAYLAARS